MLAMRARARAPVVATWKRWAVSSLVVAAGLVAAAEAYVVFGAPGRTLGSFAWPLAIACALEALLLLAILRAEESRVARELRTARTGTAVLRGLAIGRRQQLPFFARLFSTRLGTAALLLAEGDRPAALDALAGGSAFMRGGRLDELGAIVGADVERASGTSVGLERSVQQLRALPRVGNREVDLYRIHVLVKALLEQGDAEGALELAEELGPAADEEERLYLTWLRVWFAFDLDAPAEPGEPGEPGELAEAREARPWSPLTEGELRMATLLARAHGAEKLVELLEERVSSIARPEHQE